MVADALKDVIQGGRSISVDLQSIRWTDREKGLRYTYLTPRPVQLALLDFDKGIKPEPFSFQLRTAQVTRANTKKPGTERDRVPKNAGLVGATPGTTKPSKPVRVGGKTPPIGPLSNVGSRRVGLRREFGLQGLGR
jgi:hypothetical protein